MVRIPSPLVGVVSFCTALLVPSDDRTVKIYCETADVQLIKKPVLELCKNLRIACLGKLPEKPAVCALGRHHIPAEYGLKNPVIAKPVTMNSDWLPSI